MEIFDWEFLKSKNKNSPKKLFNDKIENTYIYIHTHAVQNYINYNPLKVNVRKPSSSFCPEIGRPSSQYAQFKKQGLLKIFCCLSTETHSFDDRDN